MLQTETAPPAAAPNNASTSPVDGETQLRRLIDYTNKVKARFRKEEHVYVSFYETISLAQEKGVHWVYRKLQYLFRDHQDLIKEFPEFLPKKRRTPTMGRICGGSGTRYTPSYEFGSTLEKGQWKSSEGKGGAEGERKCKVLNNTLVCKPRRKRDPSSHGGVFRSRNEHAEIMAINEEEMYEADMLVSIMRSAIVRIRKFLCKVLTNCDQGAGIHVEDHLKPGDLRCIEKIYGDMGEEMVECVKKDPARTLPHVLSRLEQKEKDWTMLRSEVMERFKEALARHHGPSAGQDPCKVLGGAPADGGHVGLGSPPPPCEGTEMVWERPGDAIGSAPVLRLGGLSLSLLGEITETETAYLFVPSNLH